MNRIKKALNVLESTKNPIIKADMIRVLREQFAGMEHTLDMQSNHVDELKSKPNNSEWIPVSERLPDEDAIVIVQGGCAYYCDGVWWSIMSADRDREIRWKVTHWMPLPEPPKGESDAQSNN